MGFGAIATAGLLGLYLWRQHRVVSLVAMGGSVAVFFSHVGLHYAKFGTFLNLPGDKQVLTLLDPNRAAWFAEHNNSFFGAGFIPTTVFHYLRPDAVAFERLVPFVRFGPQAREFGVDLESYTPSSSLSVAATGLVVLAVLGVGVALRRRMWTLAPLVAGGAIAALPTVAIGFIAHRYLVDLLPVLVLFAAVGVVSWNASRTLFARIGIGALVFWGAWVNTSFAAWLGNIENTGFTSWRYSIDDTLFSGAPPGVVAIDATNARDNNIPRDGVVGIDGNCDGLYIAVENRWRALELADGTRRIDGIFTPGSGAVVLSNSQGDRITIASLNGATLVAAFVPKDGDIVVGEEVPWRGGPVDVRIVSDPTSGWVERGLRVDINGTNSVTSLDAIDLQGFTPSQSFTVKTRTQNGTPVCVGLASRR